MAVSIRTTARTAMMQALADDVGTNAYIRAYSGSVPATVGTALGAQVLLCELRGNATQFGTVASGVLTMSTETIDSSADATGTPTFARIFKSDGTTAVIQCSAGVGSGDLNFLTSITAGQPVDITSFTLTDGNA